VCSSDRGAFCFILSSCMLLPHCASGLQPPSAMQQCKPVQQLRLAQTCRMAACHDCLAPPAWPAAPVKHLLLLPPAPLLCSAATAAMHDREYEEQMKVSAVIRHLFTLLLLCLLDGVSLSTFR